MNFKIHTETYFGKYRLIKYMISSLLLFIYMVGAWISYDRGNSLSSQAVLIDLPQRKAYFFSIIVWPEDLYYLTFLLILAAIGLFIATSLFGRIWCGYTCPHTVMVDLFMMIERIVQGDRNTRIKLDEIPMNGEKLIKKLLTHFLWISISFLFGFGWVGYFYDVRLLFNDLINFSISKNGLIWLLALTGTTYLFGGFLREKVCTHMCPYGRFQSGLFDSDTILVTYHEWRGEPRGKEALHGDCIDCKRCVIACPMGIDIRNGLQMPCIGCGLCIDAYDDVMKKMNRPLGLIQYTSENIAKKLQESWPKQSKNKVVLRPKVIFYISIFLLVFCALLASLIMKAPIELKIDKINSPLFTVTPDGSIRNSYQVTITNKTSILKSNVCLSAEDFLIKVQDLGNDYKSKYCFSLNSSESIDSQVFLILSKKQTSQFSFKRINFNFILKDDDNIFLKEQSLFYLKN